MAKASWANQSFKKSDRKKYADGGEVAEKMDLSGSAYADNSGGTWGAMGARELTKQRDDTATREINRVTSETTKAHDDDEGQRITDSFKTDTTEADRAREDRGFVPEKAKAAPVAARAAPKPKPSNEGQADRTLKRVQEKAKEAEGNEDQNDRRIKRMQKAVGNAISATKIDNTYKHRLLPVVENEMPGNEMLARAGLRKRRDIND